MESASVQSRIGKININESSPVWMRKRAGKKLGKRRSNILNSIVVVLGMCFFIGVMICQINSLQATKDAKAAELQKKTEAYEEEVQRSEELEQERVYVQSDKYIEDEARKIGYVYPDEIILKPNQN